MIRVFRHYVPNAVLLLAVLDVVLLVVAAEAGWRIRAWQIGMAVDAVHTRASQLAVFALTLGTALVAVGAYTAESLQSLRFAVARVLVAVSLGVIFQSLVFFLVPALTFWRSNLFVAMVLSVAGLVAIRLVTRRFLDGEGLKRRIVIMGAGARAARLVAMANRPSANFVVAGVIAMGEPAREVPQAVDRAAIPNLADFVVDRHATELVLAIEERRNALPLKDLLRVKTTGVHVNDFSTFIERETGRIDLSSVNPSWLIFSDGFSSGRLLSGATKRVFDIVASLALLVLALPAILLFAALVKLESRGPAFYRQRRVGLYNEPFDILKLRSMRQDAEVAGKAVWAEKDDPRITRVGRFIRRVRIDELPQCWSVLKGEMSFVGPRPERPQFVEDLERELPYYAERHMVKPGITGWAQINYPYGASVEDARHKLEYDLYYAKNYSPFLDLLILLQTLRVVLWPEGRADMAALVLWSHALAALLFAVVALAAARRGDAGLPRLSFVSALALTALWLLAVAGIGSGEVTTRVADGARQLGWLAFMLALARRNGRARDRTTVIALYAVVAVVVVAGVALALAEELARGDVRGVLIADARLMLGTMAVIAALLLVRHLHLVAVPRTRGGIRLAVLAVAAMWGIDLVLHLTAWIAGRWSESLGVARGFALVGLVPVLAIAGRRGSGTLQVSRTVAIQSLTLVAVAGYVAVTGVGTALLAEFAGPEPRMAQTALVFGSAAAMLTIGSTPWLRAWAKVIVAKHLFAHRFDYRTEWLRFTETLGSPGEGAASLDARVVKAVADLTDSPAGLLLAPEGEGLAIAAAWNWPEAEQPSALDAATATAALAQWLAATRRIVALDAIRQGRAEADEATCVPPALLTLADAWAIVPLLHDGRLEGAVVLARPPVDRPLDWEDFDLLGVAGRQVASHLAEDRARAALAEAQRFDEFNRRFAFILHDLKNMVSQLTLVARNAERHADNPAFRADMVATLQESAQRMTALLARLSQHGARSGEPARAVALLPLAQGLAASRRAQHTVRATGDAGAHAVADPAALETLLGHLVQNAIEASPAGSAVVLEVSAEGGTATIEVVDQGGGMTPAFIRDRLFKPFDSEKPGGFGIGAFEARQLARAMNGDVTVASRAGEGTRFRVTLPAADPVVRQEAA